MSIVSSLPNKSSIHSLEEAIAVARWQVLVVSSDPQSRRTLSNALALWGLTPICCTTIKQAREIVAQQSISLLFCEDRLSDGTFREILESTVRSQANTHVVVVSRTGGDEYLEAMRLGALDVISSPCQATDIDWMIVLAIRGDLKSAKLC